MHTVLTVIICRMTAAATALYMLFSSAAKTDKMTLTWLIRVSLASVLLQVVETRSLHPSDEVDTHHWSVLVQGRHLNVLDGSKLKHGHHDRRRTDAADSDLPLAASLPTHLGMIHSFMLAKRVSEYLLNGTSAQDRLKHASCSMHSL